MKRSRITRLLLMGAAPLTLVACAQEDPALLYASAGDCRIAGQLSDAECSAAFSAAAQQHAESAPQHATREECVAEYGEGQCTQHRTGTFIPLMAGFLLARSLNGAGAAVQPAYRGRDSQFRTASGVGLGRSIGPIHIPPAARAAPARAVTVSRAGFGTRAATRSSWGG